MEKAEGKVKCLTPYFQQNKGQRCQLKRSDQSIDLKHQHLQLSYVHYPAAYKVGNMNIQGTLPLIDITTSSSLNTKTITGIFLRGYINNNL